MRNEKSTSKRPNYTVIILTVLAFVIVAAVTLGITIGGSFNKDSGNVPAPAGTNSSGSSNSTGPLITPAPTPAPVPAPTPAPKPAPAPLPDTGTGASPKR